MLNKYQLTCTTLLQYVIHMIMEITAGSWQWNKIHEILPVGKSIAKERRLPGRDCIAHLTQLTPELGSQRKRRRQKGGQTSMGHAAEMLVNQHREADFDIWTFSGNWIWVQHIFRTWAWISKSVHKHSEFIRSCPSLVGFLLSSPCGGTTVSSNNLSFYRQSPTR